MALSVVITLTTAGTDTGPFSLYSNIDGYLSAFETGVPKSSLEAGYLSTLVPDGTTTIRVLSQDVLCGNYVDMTIEGTTTTTTSSTSTTTTTTTTTACVDTIDVTISVSDSITGNPNYRYNLDTSCDSEDITLTSPDNDGPISMCLCGGSILDTRVRKVSNAGIAQDEVVISWQVNAVEVNSVTINAGNAVNEFYTITGLVTGDEVDIIVSEG